MSETPDHTILGEAAVSAACYALANGQDLNRMPLEDVALTVLRAAASAASASTEVTCTEGEEWCDHPEAREAYRLCDAHETAQAHARGEHRWCDIECRDAMGTEEMTNFVVAKGYPGTAGVLRELLRRAAEDAVKAVCGGTIPPQPPVPERAEPGREVHVWTDRYAVSSFPFGHPDYHAFLVHVVRRGEGWAVTDGAGWLATDAGAWTIDTYGAKIFPSAGEAKRIAVRMTREVLLRLEEFRPQT